LIEIEIGIEIEIEIEMDGYKQKALGTFVSRALYKKARHAISSVQDVGGDGDNLDINKIRSSRRP
jgi:hypothetical protein